MTIRLTSNVSTARRWARIQRGIFNVLKETTNLKQSYKNEDEIEKEKPREFPNNKSNTK